MQKYMPWAAPSQRLSLTYILAISLIAVCLLVAVIFELRVNAGQQVDARVINTAGRQRMLSQQLAKTSLALCAAEHPEEIARWRDELERVLDAWSAAQRRLVTVPREIQMPEEHRHNLQIEWNAVQSHFQAIREAAYRMLEATTNDAGDSATPADPAILDAAVGTIMVHENQFLRRMNSIVDAYVQRADARLEHLWEFKLLTGIAFATSLLAVSLFLFHPLARSVQQQSTHLEAANRAIDEKEELERLNTQLAQENQRRKESEYRVRLLLDSTAEAIYGLDLEGNCTFCNAACVMALGYDDPAMLVGRNMHELIHHTRPDGTSYPVTECQICQACREGKGTHVDDEVLWRADGTCFPVEYWSYPVFEENTIVGAVVAFTDLSERRKMEASIRESEERFRQLAENVDELFWLTSADGREMIYVNPAYERIFGRSCESLYARPDDWLDGVHPDDRERVAKAVFELGPSGRFDEEFRVVRGDGGLRWVRARGSAVCDAQGEVYRMGGVAWDITEQKQQNELKAARDRAEAANVAKSQFLANISHELRTPLHGSIGMVDLLCKTPLDKHQQALAEACRTSARSLLELINDVLDFSKIETGKLVLDHHEFEVDRVVEDAVRLMGPRAWEKRLELVSSIDRDVCRRVSGDSVRLRQVLVNLIGNALKFTHHGEVVVRVGLENIVDQLMTVRFEVSDTGIGIPADQVEHLFDSFSQGDGSTTRSYGGTGLGLAISKSLVEAMGGRIDVASEEGSGSTFWFTAQFEWISDLTARDNLPADLRQRRVFVAAANRTLADSLREAVSRWALATEVGATGEETLQQLRQAATQGAPFDLLITDHQLPDLSGTALADAVQADQELSATRVLLLTMLDDAEADHRPLVRRLIKPVCQSELLNVVIDWFCQPAEQPETRLEESGERRACPDGGVAGETRILLAEDNRINCMYAEQVAHRAGWTCQSVSNGALAVEAVQSSAFDVILMDCHMPEMDGFEATRRIREMERDGRLQGHRPIVALTANAVQGDRERCLDAGMDDYLSKPFEAEALIGVLNRVLGKPQRRLDESEDRISIPEDEPTPIDTRTFLARCRNDADFVAELLAELENSGPQRVESIARHAAAGDAIQTAEAAHSLKGAAGMFAADRLQRVAAGIEAAGKTGELADVASLLDDLRSEMARCLAFVPAVRAQAESNKRRTNQWTC